MDIFQGRGLRNGRFILPIIFPYLITRTHTHREREKEREEECAFSIDTCKTTVSKEKYQIKAKVWVF